MTDLVEQLAKAMYEQTYITDWPPVPFDSELRSAEDWRNIAKTVLHVIDKSVIGQALREADDALASLRRSHGIEVSTLCYPARNTVSDALIELRISRADAP